MYLPAKRNQHRNLATGREWGTPYDRSNCGATVTAEAVDFATLGKRHPTPPDVRRETRQARRPLRLVDTARAAAAFDVEPTLRYGLPWARVRQLLERPRVAIHFQTDYEFIQGKNSCLPSYDEEHAMLAFGGTLEGGDVLTSDPLCGERKRIPLWQLRQAATAYAMDGDHPADTVICAIYRRPLTPEEQPAPEPVPEPEDDRDDVLAQVAGLSARIVALTAPWQPEAEA